MSDRSDRIITWDNVVLEDGLTPDEAAAAYRARRAAGEDVRWHRWCGERSGWNSVA